VESTSLPCLNSLLVDCNQLSGEIPLKIMSWKLLATLNLSGNKLSSQIPAVVGSLPWPQILPPSLVVCMQEYKLLIPFLEKVG
jgi:hypothetical protein